MIVVILWFLLCVGAYAVQPPYLPDDTATREVIFDLYRRYTETENKLSLLNRTVRDIHAIAVACEIPMHIVCDTVRAQSFVQSPLMRTDTIAGISASHIRTDRGMYIMGPVGIRRNPMAVNATLLVGQDSAPYGIALNTNSDTVNNWSGIYVYGAFRDAGMYVYNAAYPYGYDIYAGGMQGLGATRIETPVISSRKSNWGGDPYIRISTWVVIAATVPVVLPPDWNSLPIGNDRQPYMYVRGGIAARDKLTLWSGHHGDDYRWKHTVHGFDDGLWITSQKNIVFGSYSSGNSFVINHDRITTGVQPYLSITTGVYAQSWLTVVSSVSTPVIGYSPELTLNSANIILTAQADSPNEAVRADRLVNTGPGLLGGGNLTADRTISLDTTFTDTRYLRNPATTDLNMNTYAIVNIGSMTWTGGKIKYVPIGASLATYISQANAGDVLQLAAGTYTLTGMLNITKRLTIAGQSPQDTWVVANDIDGTALLANASGIVFRNFSLHVMVSTFNASAFYGIRAALNVLLNLDTVNIYCTSTKSNATHTLIGINSAGTLRMNNCQVYVFGSSASLTDIRSVSILTPEFVTTNTITNCYLYAYGVFNYSMVTVNIYSNRNYELYNIIQNTIMVAENNTAPNRQILLYTGRTSPYPIPSVLVQNCQLIGVNPANGSGFTSDEQNPTKHRFINCLFTHHPISAITAPGITYTAREFFVGDPPQIRVSSHSVSTNTLFIEADSSVNSWIRNNSNLKINLSHNELSLTAPRISMNADVVSIRSSITWTGGKVQYVPLGSNLATYISQANAGDVLQLAAGTYTITTAVGISKSITIQGQGKNATWVLCSGNNLEAFYIWEQNNIRLAHMSIIGTSGTGFLRLIRLDGNTGGTQNLVLENLDVINYHNDGIPLHAINLLSGQIINCRFINSHTNASNGGIAAFFMYLSGLTTGISRIDINNSYFESNLNSSLTAIGLEVNTHSAATQQNITLIDSVVRGINTGAGRGIGLRASGNKSIIHITATSIHGSHIPYDRLNDASLQPFGSLYAARGLFIGTTTQLCISSHVVSTNTLYIEADSSVNSGLRNANNIRVTLSHNTLTLTAPNIVLASQADATNEAVRADRAINTGTGLQGGGNLTGDRTISLDTAWTDARYIQNPTTGSINMNGYHIVDVTSIVVTGGLGIRGAPSPDGIINMFQDGVMTGIRLGTSGSPQNQHGIYLNGAWNHSGVYVLNNKYPDSYSLYADGIPGLGATRIETSVLSARNKSWVRDPHITISTNIYAVVTNQDREAPFVFKNDGSVGYTVQVDGVGGGIQSIARGLASPAYRADIRGDSGTGLLVMNSVASTQSVTGMYIDVFGTNQNRYGLDIIAPSNRISGNFLVTGITNIQGTIHNSIGSFIVNDDLTVTSSATIQQELSAGVIRIGGHGGVVYPYLVRNESDGGLLFRFSGATKARLNPSGSLQLEDALLFMPGDTGMYRNISGNFIMQVNNTDTLTILPGGNMFNTRGHVGLWFADNTTTYNCGMTRREVPGITGSALAFRGNNFNDSAILMNSNLFLLANSGQGIWFTTGPATYNYGMYRNSDGTTRIRSGDSGIDALVLDSDELWVPTQYNGLWLDSVGNRRAGIKGVPVNGVQVLEIHGGGSSGMSITDSEIRITKPVIISSESSGNAWIFRQDGTKYEGVPYVSVRMNTSQDINTGVDATIQFNNIVRDNFNRFNTSNYTYTVPKTGLYDVRVLLRAQTGSGDSATGLYLRIKINGNTIQEITGAIPLAPSNTSVLYSGFIELSNGDQMTISLNPWSSNVTVSNSSAHTVWCMRYISDIP